MKRYIISLLLFVFLLFSTNAHAAELFFELPNQPVVNQTFDVQVLVDSPDEYINAYEGTINFEGLVELKDVSDANSIVSLWVERPQINENEVRFSGITPGGFQDINGLLFTITAETNSEDQISASFKDIQILLHDGEGTPAEVTSESLSMEISPIGSKVSTTSDTTPPELFSPIISRDENAFEGQWFVAFNTQDKQSGIDHYEVKESLLPVSLLAKWNTAQSPYVLNNQSRTYYVSVKAIDKAGNERVVTLPPKYPCIKPLVIVSSAIIVSTLLIIWFVAHNRRKKLKENPPETEGG